MVEQTREIIYFGPAIQEISCKDFFYIYWSLAVLFGGVVKLVQY